MRGGGDAVLSFGHAARRRDFGADLRARQHPAVPGLGALAQLDFDHLDLILRGAIAEAFGVEPPHLVARSEEHTSEQPSLMRNSYAVFCLKNKKSSTYWCINTCQNADTHQRV